MKTKMKEKWLDIMDAVNIIPDGRTVLVKMENGAFKTAKYDVKNGIVGFFRKNKLIYPKMWHEINLDDYILELCPECEEEIIILFMVLRPVTIAVILYIPVLAAGGQIAKNVPMMALHLKKAGRPITGRS